jgi:hypothetical protein
LLSFFLLPSFSSSFSFSLLFLRSRFSKGLTEENEKEEEKDERERSSSAFVPPHRLRALPAASPQI